MAIEVTNTKGGRIKVREKGDPKPEGSGRRKKLFGEVTAEIIALGYGKVGKEETIDLIQVMLALPMPELMKIAKDETASVFARVVIKELLGKNGFQAVQALLDRAHGKPNQSIKTEGDGNFIVHIGRPDYIEPIEDSE